MTRGISSNVSSMALPRKDRLASRYPEGRPRIRAIMIAAMDVKRLRRRAKSTYGEDMAFPSSFNERRKIRAKITPATRRAKRNRATKQSR
jgi:hypothetical protein